MEVSHFSLENLKFNLGRRKREPSFVLFLSGCTMHMSPALEAQSPNRRTSKEIPLGPNFDILKVALMVISLDMLSLR